MRYSKETPASVTEIMQRARQQFGSDGAGLQQSAVSMLEVTYSGPIGSIDVSIQPLGNGLNEVVVSSQALDDEASRFARSLPQSSPLDHLLRVIRLKVKPRARP